MVKNKYYDKKKNKEKVDKKKVNEKMKNVEIDDNDDKWGKNEKRKNEWNKK